MSKERYFSSPCLMGLTAEEINEHYMTNIPKKWIDLLQELLMAERAGLRVASESLEAELSEEEREVVKGVRECEARSCKVLREILLDLGEEPANQVGRFYDKAMATQDIQQRIALIDRGRGWVFNKIEAELEHCANDRIGIALRSVLELHREPITIKR